MFVGIGQLFFYYSSDLTSVLLIIIGLGLSILSYQRINKYTTDFTMELEILLQYVVLV